MDVTAKPMDIGINNPVVAGSQSQDVSVKQEAAVQQFGAKTEEDSSQMRLSNKEVTELTEEMNKIMDDMDTNIQFAVHEKTQKLMVQVVNRADNKVLREYPPHEFLDTIAKISDYIGALLDKKA